MFDFTKQPIAEREERSMGWEESQFGGLGPRKPKQPKQPKKQKTYGYVSTPSQNTYQPQQTPYPANQVYSQQNIPQLSSTRHLDANLKPTSMPFILRAIGILVLVLGCGASLTALTSGFSGIYLLDWNIFGAFIYVFAGLISMLPFFYWAKKLELLEEIRNALYKDRFKD